MTKDNVYAIADIGANTVKCTVFDLRGGISELCTMVEKLGIIARIENGILPADGVDLLCKTLCDFKARSLEYGAGSFMPFATASLRAANNFDEIDRAVFDAVGVRISLLSAEEEGKTAFAGMKLLNPSVKRGVMADMGGGSTELVAFDPDGVQRVFSMPFGCLSLYKRFVEGDFPSDGELSEIADFVKQNVIDAGFSRSGNNLFIIGGTGKAIAKLIKKFNISQSKKINAEILNLLLDRLKKKDPRDIALVEELIPTRRETIIPGLCAYCAIAEELYAKSVKIVKGGLREGVISKIYGQKNEQ